MAKTKEKTVKEKRDLRQELTEKLLTQMEKGEAFWQRPWERGELEAPFNAVTGKSYRGVNSQNLMLFTPDPADNRWCTYKQAQEQGWQVKKGAHGTQIEKWTDCNRKLTDEEIRAQREAGVAEPETEERRLRVSYFTVFHASQIDGIPPRERPEQEVHLDNAVDERLPQLASAMGVEVGYAGTRAFYRPSTDSVNLPPLELFKSGQDHDTVFLHELSHSTGHASRLNRDLSGGFGSSNYAKEELRAELSAAMTAMSLGLGFSPEAQNQEEGRTVSGVENTAAYLNSWLRGLPENDRKKELMKAISDAQKISDYLMERTPEIEKTVEIKKEHYPELIRPTEKEAALESVREFYEHLPDHVQELMGTIKDRHEELSPVDFEGHRKVRVDFQAGVDDVLGIIREGPDRGANKHWLTLEKAGFTPDEISKMPLMDDVQNATRRHGQNLSAFSKELDTQFTENLKAHGKEILQNSEPLSKQDMAQAVYWKHGVQVESTDNPMLNRFIDAVENKDLPKLLSSIGHNSMNPASQEVFERITGESLGKTQKDRVETLEKWAGPDVVQAMKSEQAKKVAEQAIEKPIKNLQNRYAGLKEVLVRTQDSQKGEIVLNGQDYLSSSIEKGFTETFAKPKGAVIEYGLLNKEEGIYRTVKDTRISQFAKAVREVDLDGKILPALEKAGITLTKEKTLQEKVSERMKAKGFSL